MYRSNHRY